MLTLVLCSVKNSYFRHYTKIAESSKMMWNESSNAASQEESTNIFCNIYLNHSKCTHLPATVWTMNIIITNTKNNKGKYIGNTWHENKLRTMIDYDTYIKWWEILEGAIKAGSCLQSIQLLANYNIKPNSYSHAALCIANYTTSYINILLRNIMSTSINSS